MKIIATFLLLLIKASTGITQSTEVFVFQEDMSNQVFKLLINQSKTFHGLGSISAVQPGIKDEGAQFPVDVYQQKNKLIIEFQVVFESHELVKANIALSLNACNEVQINYMTKSMNQKVSVPGHFAGDNCNKLIEKLYSRAIPDFSILPNNDSGYVGVNRKIVVFGIPIYAVPFVSDDKLIHAAKILAEYLDNDENGAVDNALAHSAMLNNNSFLFMWKSKSDFDNVNFPNNAIGQDLGNDETTPSWHLNGHNGQFDAALEEVLHIITHGGFAQAYPQVFGEQINTSLADAMDIARGGRFITIPNQYPPSAWYTYDDITCDYSCMSTEYFYWALTSLLGAQSNRLNEISQEWQLNTPELIQTTDTAAHVLLTDPLYKLPSSLPNGEYIVNFDLIFSNGFQMSGSKL